MLSFPQAVLDAMDAGREVIRGLIRFDLGSGTYGFTNGGTPFTHDGVTYAPSSLIKVSALGMGMARSPGALRSNLPLRPMTPDAAGAVDHP